MKILSTAFYRHFPAWTLPDWAVEELRHQFPQFAIVKLTSPERIRTEIADADILLAGYVREDDIRAAKRLKWIHAPMAGLEGVLIPAVIDSGILVSNSRGVHAIPMAEHAMALILAMARKLPELWEDQRAGVCRRTERLLSTPSFEEVYAKRVGVVGLGAIGSEIARRASAFGMRVMGIRRRPELKPEFVEAVYAPDRLDDLLPSLDYVVLAAPVTPQTAGMIGSRQFQRMKSTAFLVNVARGELVDQEALIQALESGGIAGAALDVMIPDPLPDKHPLYGVKNLLITPHISGISPMLWRRMLDLWMENIRRFLEGRELINQVADKRKGY